MPAAEIAEPAHPNDAPSRVDRWQPELSYDFLAREHAAEVEFDPNEFNRLLDDLGVGQERSTISGVEFAGQISSHDGSDPTGLYEVEARKIYVRVLKRIGTKYMLTKKRSAREPDEINEDIVHEVRHFLQHLGHIAAGEDYLLATRVSTSNMELEKEANDFARQNANKYKIVTSAYLARPKYRHTKQDL